MDDTLRDILAEVQAIRAALTQPNPQGVAAAQQAVRSVALELVAAAEALDGAAKLLHDDHRPWRAKHTKLAADRARAAAEQLTGGSGT